MSADLDTLRALFEALETTSLHQDRHFKETKDFAWKGAFLATSGLIEALSPIIHQLEELEGPNGLRECVRRQAFWIDESLALVDGNKKFANELPNRISAKLNEVREKALEEAQTERDAARAELAALRETLKKHEASCAEVDALRTEVEQFKIALRKTVEILEAKFPVVRREALEEAASICDKSEAAWRQIPSEPEDPVWYRKARDARTAEAQELAHAIRALAK